ncbi:hypothetical protein D3C87_1887150 [compost metagenome]
MHLQGGQALAQSQQQINHLFGRSPLVAGSQGVLLHLAPGGFAGERARQRLQRIVQPVQHEVLGVIQHPLRLAAPNGVAQNVGDGGPVVRTPNEGQWIDLTAQ